MKTEELTSSLMERFFRFVQVWTTSDSVSADSGNQPSTQRQFELAKILEAELKDFGLKDIQVTPHCYVYGRLPPSSACEKIEPFCLLSHIDTVEEVSGQNVKPQIYKNYDGKDIVLKSGDILSSQNDEALALVALEILIAVVKQLREFSRVGRSRRIIKLAGRIESDAGFRRVGDDETHLALFGELEIGLEIGVRIEAAAHDIDKIDAVHGGTVEQALKVEMVEAILLVEPLDHTFLDGLHHDDGCVEVSFLVGLPYYPLDESAKEVTLTELDDLFRIALRLRRRSTI